MARVMNLWPQTPRNVEDFVQVEAVLECEGFGRRILWYRVPESQACFLSLSADAVTVAAIFAAMRYADLLHVHGQVSPSLLSNLIEFQTAWSRWVPEKYRVIGISADLEIEEVVDVPFDSVMAFSGGLDSCFTAWRHTKGRQGRLVQNVSAGVMVHGFDIPVSEQDVFKRAVDNSRYLLESVGLRSLNVATNFRDLGDVWIDAHGAAIASVLHLLKRGFRGGVVASSHVYNAMRYPWGSNPITDPLLSSVGFRVHHDGCGFNRRQKAGVVAAWPEAMLGLRVCWQGAQKDKNCGICLRCVATAMCFELENAPLPRSLFVQDIAAAIDSLALQKLPAVAVMRLSELLDYAESNNLKLPWVGALRRLIISRKNRLSMITNCVRIRLLKNFKKNNRFGEKETSF